MMQQDGLMQQNELSFKYRPVSNGNPVGLSAKSGTASQDALILDEDTIPYAAIAMVRYRGDRAVVALSRDVPLGKRTQKGLTGDRALALEIRGKQALPFTRHINRWVSAHRAEQHRRELAERGEEGKFRTVICSHCGATIDLSGFETTRYTYCDFCQSLLERDLSLVSDGDEFQQCSSCSLHGRVRRYTAFQFYFLLVVYGFSYRQVYLCDTCAAKLARRNLLTNLIFVLGVPPAIITWIRALSGRDEFLKALDRANGLFIKKKYAEADEAYTALLQEHGEHPAVLMNQAMARFNAQGPTEGWEVFKTILKVCGNYLPAIRWANTMRREANVATDYR